MDDNSEFDIDNCGLWILISNLDIDINEIISTYYMRQSVESLFYMVKSDLNILPERTHTEETFRGFMFMIFLSIIACRLIKSNCNTCLIEVFEEMRNLKCKVFEKDLVIGELTVKQKEYLKLMVPN